MKHVTMITTLTSVIVLVVACSAQTDPTSTSSRGRQLNKDADSISVVINDNGQRVEIPYAHGRQNGILVIYYKGQSHVLSERAIVDGKLNGTETLYDTTGRITRTTNWNNGLAHGVETYYYPNGSIQDVTNWWQGKRHGARKGFHANGKPKYVESYTNGNLDGIQEVWDEKGKRTRKRWIAGETEEQVRKRKALDFKSAAEVRAWLGRGSWIRNNYGEETTITFRKDVFIYARSTGRMMLGEDRLTYRILQIRGSNVDIRVYTGDGRSFGALVVRVGANEMMYGDLVYKRRQ